MPLQDALALMRNKIVRFLFKNIKLNLQFSNHAY